MEQEQGGQEPQKKEQGPNALQWDRGAGQQAAPENQWIEARFKALELNYTKSLTAMETKFNQQILATTRQADVTAASLRKVIAHLTQLHGFED